LGRRFFDTCFGAFFLSALGGEASLICLGDNNNTNIASSWYQSLHQARSFKLLVLTLLASRSLPLFACDNPVSFEIDPLPVDRALLRFAQQANISALFPSGTFGDIKANRVVGSYCIEDALEALLDGSDVEATMDETGLLVVKALDDDSSNAERDQHQVSIDETAGTAPKGKIKRLMSLLGSLFTGGGEAAERRRAEAVLPEEITITGSRIRQLTGMTTPTPVTTVSSIELASFDPGSTVAEQLDSLPQFFSTQTAQRGGTTFIGAGGSYLNLRGMGTNRTLVLLNGTRVIPSDSFGHVNVDNFPAALLDHVDIVTGGASAAYGADAISGVVNFILDREFTGLRASVSTGVTERGDGENWKFSVAGGRQFGDHLHFTGSVDARYIDQIDPDPDRLDNWLDWGHVRNPDWNPADVPGTHPRLITVPFVFSTSYSPQGLITTPGFKYSYYTFTDDGLHVRPYQYGQLASLSGRGATRTQSGGAEYPTSRASRNGGPSSNEVVQRSLFMGLKYDLSEDVDLYGQVLLGRSESNAYGRRGGPALDSIWSATIYAENPYLPAEVRQAMQDSGRDFITVSKRGTKYGPGLTNYYANRGDRNINQLESVTIGFNAALRDSWKLEGSYQRGKSRVSSSALNILRLDNFYMALDAIRDPVTGAPVCHVSMANPTPAQLKASVEGKLLASPLSLTGVEVNSPIGPMNFSECVPINVFGLGNVSPAASAWVEDEEKKNLRTLEQDFYELLLTGELYEGWGAGPLTLATGLGYRAEQFSQWSLPLWGERGLSNAPELGIRGIPGGFTGPGNRSLHQFSAIGAGSGDFDVSEWFGELNIPIFDTRSGQALRSSFAVRSSDYSIHEPILSWKAGLDLQIVPDLRWRFTRSRDVREPNFSEKFVSGVGGATLYDPVFNEAYVITSIGGPNPDLATEQAHTTTTGLVWQPTNAGGLDGVQLSVDWYVIDLSSSVGRLGAQRLTNECFSNSAEEICALVQRNPVTNRVDRVIDRYFNTGSARTSGVDLEFRYLTEPDFFAGLFETFDLKAYIGYLKENSITTEAGKKFDAVKSRERPQYTANITASYKRGSFDISLQQRYYDSTLLSTAWVEGVDVDDNTIASQSLTNLGFGYEHNSDSNQTTPDWSVNFFITNLFDREPPVIPGQVLSNSHDQVGRRFQLSLTANF
jgi:outer membrane receptor protein involved in Fe transport